MIISLENDIYLTGNTVSNFAIYKLVSDNQSQYGHSLEIVNSNQPIRKDYNLTVSDGKIIVSGGATDCLDSRCGRKSTACRQKGRLPP